MKKTSLVTLLVVAVQLIGYSQETNTNQAPASTNNAPTKCDIAAVRQSQDKYEVWEGVVKGSSIFLFTDNDMDFVVVPPDKVVLPKDGTKVIVSGTVVGAHMISDMSSNKGDTSFKTTKHVEIEMKDCKIQLPTTH
jgi:hypothetical protein